MKYKNNTWISFIILLGAIVGFTSCADEDIYSAPLQSGRSLVLSLPQDDVVEVSTRAVDENKVSDILAVIIRGGEAQYEHIGSFTTSNEEGKIIAILHTLEPKEGETLYVFCNTEEETVTAKDEPSLFQAFTFDNSGYKKNIMYGSQTLDGTSDLSVTLNHAMAKASVSSTVADFNVKSWKVCNVPSLGDFSYNTYPDGVTFDNSVDGVVGGNAYFIPRKDNSTTTSDLKTCVLANLTEGSVDKGWYRLDFYNKGVLEDINAAITLMDIQPNCFYKFNITKVAGNGYSTEEEAKSNPGSNITYNMEVIDNRYATSNGQYLLRTNKDKIILAPIGADADGETERSVEAITLSVVIPPNSNANISTFSVKIVDPENNGQLYFKKENEKGELVPVDSLSLLNAGSLTASGKYKIELYFHGANVQGTYLRITLGNITREIPIEIETSNCYLFNFMNPQEGEPKTLYIPIAQANLDKTRVPSDGDFDVRMIWSDQSNLTKENLVMKYDKDKQWIQIAPTVTFKGNVIIGLEDKKDRTIKWSWHIWALDSEVLKYVPEKGYYDFNEDKINTHNTYRWMDRNLGAYDLTPGASASRGLLYQWGRKDPFPGGSDGLIKDETSVGEADIYCDGQVYRMDGLYPGDGSPCSVSVIPAKPEYNNLEYSIQHPWQYIKGLDDLDNVESDWLTYGGEKLNNLWLEKDLSKGIYNPCPNGWTMPVGGKYGPWIGLVPTADVDKRVADGGFHFKDAGYFPFTQVRLTTTETNVMSLGVATYTNLWWGDHPDTRASTQIFNTVFLPREFCQRHAAYSVRCVKIEEIE